MAMGGTNSQAKLHSKLASREHALHHHRSAFSVTAYMPRKTCATAFVLRMRGLHRDLFEKGAIYCFFDKPPLPVCWKWQFPFTRPQYASLTLVHGIPSTVHQTFFVKR